MDEKKGIYMLSSGIGNMLHSINNYNINSIKEEVKKGMTVVKVGADGKQEVATPEEAASSQTVSLNKFTVLTPKYVDDRMNILNEALNVIAKNLPQDDKEIVLNCIEKLNDLNKLNESN